MALRARFGPASRTRGFTIIELLIVISVIAILAAIAFPSYQSYVLGARRADGQSELLKMQLAMEKWRASNNAYTTVTNSTGINFPASNAYYTFTVPAAASASYTLRATAAGAQTADTGCTQVNLNQSGARTPAACWK